MVRNGFSKLTIKLFVPLYGSFEIWPTNFVVDYLQQQRLKYGMKITNKEWIKLFQTVSKRYLSCKNIIGYGTIFMAPHKFCNSKKL